MNKYTPRPWQLSTVPFELMTDDCAATIYGNCKNGGSPLICGVSRSPGDEEAIGNAKLIASAPDLLEALQSLRSYVVRELTLFHNLTEKEIYIITRRADDAIKMATE